MLILIKTRHKIQNEILIKRGKKEEKHFF